ETTPLITSSATINPSPIVVALGKKRPIRGGMLGLALLVLEHPLHGVFGQFGPRRQLELLFYVFPVRLDRLGADPELDGDLPAAQPLAHQVEDLHLAIGEPVDGGAADIDPCDERPLNDELGHVRTEIEFACEDRAYGLHDRAAGFMLAD